MNKLILVIFTIILLTIIVIGCAGSSTTTNKLTGTIYVSGNEPFTYLALNSVDDKYYKIECSDSLKKELWQLQGKVVELKFDEIKQLENQNTIIISEYKLNNEPPKE